MSHIYVDHAATTPLYAQVIEAMLPHLKAHFGNPSSIHALGRETRAILDQARKKVAESIGAQAGDIVFTSGGTEADNMALIGCALANQDRGTHIITSAVEHHAVLHACQYLERSGFNVTYLPVDQYGRVQVDELDQALQEDTILVSIMYGNNEVGTLQPIREISQLLASEPIYFHTDAVQALGIEEMNVDRYPVDLLSLSAHKINGPKGIGCLYIADGIKLHPLLFGGNQERNRRAGTENLAGIVGFSEAIQINGNHRQERKARYLGYRKRLLQGLDKWGVEYHINGHPEQFLAHILNLSFPGTKNDALLMNLDLEGVAASSGSACSAGSLEPSHVLQAMVEDEERVDSSIRFSFGLGNTLEEMDQLAQIIANIVRRLKE